MGDFLDPRGEIERHGRLLPHWQQGEVMQFVTFRLGDAMPQEKLLQWKEELGVWKRHHPEPWTDKDWQEYHRRFTRKLEEWLDAGSGSCLFADPGIRGILAETFMHDHGTSVIHHAWVIMPNHVHMLFSPLKRIELLIQCWKGVSARRIGHGPVWQKGYRDTMIRSPEHFANVVRYIRCNPKGLKPDTFTLWQGSKSLEVE
jgi:Transposase IS200 like